MRCVLSNATSIGKSKPVLSSLGSAPPISATGATLPLAPAPKISTLSLMEGELEMLATRTRSVESTVLPVGMSSLVKVPPIVCSGGAVPVAPAVYTVTLDGTPLTT